ncbi:hypothetical protein Tco_1169857, partial [Tanacetum coccineum]
LQVKQKNDGIFISQDKYVTEILKKFGFTDVKTASTPMETQKLLLKDEDGEQVDVHLYRSMIGSSMYLTSSRPDIIYLKGQSKLGLWYPKDSPFDLVAYIDSDYAGASLDRKSTTGEAEYVATSSYYGQVLWIQNQLLDYGDSNEKKLNQMIKIHIDKNIADLLTKAFDKGIGVNAGDSKLMLLVDEKKIIITEATVRRDLQLEDADGVDCFPNATIFEQLTLMGYEIFSQKLTFYKAFFSPEWKFLIHIILQCLSAKTTAWNEFSSTMIRLSIRRWMTVWKGLLTTADAEQDRGNINKTQSKATLNKPSSIGTSSGSGPRRQDTIGDTIAQTRSKNVSKLSNDPLLARDKGVKKLEKKAGSRTHKLKRLYKVGRSARIVSSDEASLGDQEDASKQGRKIDDIDNDTKITLVDETQGRYGDDIMFDVSDLASEEVFVAEQGVPNSKKGDAAQVSTAATTVSIASIIPVRKDKKRQKDATQKYLKNRRNERDKSKSEKSARDHSRISPTQRERQSKKETMKSKGQVCQKRKCVIKKKLERKNHKD